jgi:hypothetical protein
MDKKNMGSIDPKNWDKEENRGGLRKKKKPQKPKKKRKGYKKPKKQSEYRKKRGNKW